jgi:hypothetical protein
LWRFLFAHVDSGFRIACRTHADFAQIAQLFPERSEGQFVVPGDSQADCFVEIKDFMVVAGVLRGCELPDDEFFVLREFIGPLRVDVNDSTLGDSKGDRPFPDRGVKRQHPEPEGVDSSARSSKRPDKSKFAWQCQPESMLLVDWSIAKTLESQPPRQS